MTAMSDAGTTSEIEAEARSFAPTARAEPATGGEADREAEPGSRSLGTDLGLRAEKEFELALRGYHRGQVDRFVARCEAQIATLASELATTRERERVLGERVGPLEAELADCTCGPQFPASRVVGVRVQRMIMLAEEEAAALRERGERDAEELRTAGAAVLAEARSVAEQAMRDFQVALVARRAEERTAEAGRRAEADAAVRRDVEAAHQLSRQARALSADTVEIVRRLLNALGEQRARLGDELQRVERNLAAMG